MLIGMRNAMLADGGVSAKSYIQDGLIAMWDGIENAGWGVHDNSARAVDLMGRHPDLSSFSRVTDNAMVFTSNDYCLFAAADLADYRAAINSGNFSFEFCGEIATTYKFWKTIIYSSAGGNNSRFNIRPNFDSTNTIYRGIQAFAYSSSGVPGISIGSAYPQVVPSDLAFSNISMTCRADGSGIVCCDDNSFQFTGGVFPIATSNAALCFNREMASGSAKNAAPGNWHCIRWYNRALTAAEIAHNRAVDKERFGLP